MTTPKIMPINPGNPHRRGLNRMGWMLLVLLLFSAFSLVYVKDLNRRLSRDHQRLQARYVVLQTEWEKLLLERGVWTSQSRIQRVAQQDLHMHLPTAKDTLLLQSDQPGS
jgi:cell division protein FtsL